MQQEKEQVALTSIAASAALTVAKGVVGVLTGSLAILSEAGHSLIDLGATVMTYAAVRISGKPADEEHHYGHGKVESISALAETTLLFLLSGVVIWEAVKRLTEHEDHTVIASAWALKNVFGRLRPYELFAHADWSHAWFAGGNSFPSGHNAFFWGLFMPLMYLFPRYRFALLLVPVFIALARIDVSMHFASDVLASIALAALVTLLAAMLCGRWIKPAAR